VAAGAHAPWPVQVPNADHVPLLHVRVWVPQLPQACVAGPTHVQDPATQLDPPGHAFPQAPQLFGSVCLSTQAPPQLAYPVLQVLVQVPALQPAVACGSVTTHACAHTPQFATSLDSFTQVPPHSVVGDAQVVAHAPMPLQLEPVPQTLVQEPQWLLSFDSLTHVEPQSISPAPQTHAAHWQVEEHVCVPVASHAWVAAGAQTP
jgi:hypothetical protein